MEAVACQTPAPLARAEPPARLRPDAGLRAGLSEPDRARCRCRPWPPRPWEHGIAGVLKVMSDPRALAALRLSFGMALRRVGAQRRVRPDRRLGAGALPLSRAAPARRHGRPALRPADRRRRHRADRPLRPERLDRRPLAPLGIRDRLHAARASSSRWCSSACRSWCARSSRCSTTSTPRSRRPPRRSAPARWQRCFQRDPALAAPGAAHRLRARLRPRRSANTARSSSSPATCPIGPRSRRC